MKRKNLQPSGHWKYLVWIGMCSLFLQGSIFAEKSEELDRLLDEFKISDEVKEKIGTIFPSLVRISMVVEVPRQGKVVKRVSGGSGAIIDKQGHVITNHHVAGNALRITCRMPNGEEIPAKLVGTDPLSDIAIVKLQPEKGKFPQGGYPAATFGDSDALKVGDTVFALGSPAGLTQCVTQGIVSNLAMTMPKIQWYRRFMLDGEDVGSYVPWIGHDAIIFGGNSGGPLVNNKGEIIGVNEIGLARLGGAVPGNLAKKIADELIAKGEVERSWVGIRGQSRLRKSSKHDKGILVGSVIKGSPADRAGLKSGDIITKYYHEKVNSANSEDGGIQDFNQKMMHTPIGKEIEVEVYRDGKIEKIVVVPEKREPPRARDKELESWGMTARKLTQMSALKRGRLDDQTGRANKRGVLVSSLRPNGPCHRANPPLKREDILMKVNGQEVNTPQDLLEIAQQSLESEPKAKLFVEFDRKAQKLASMVEIQKKQEIEEPIPTKKAWLPIRTQVLTKDLVEALAVDTKYGVRITEVFSGYAAERAGMQAGDILTAIDGETIKASTVYDKNVFANMLGRKDFGQKIVVDGLRDNEPVQFTLELARSPKTPAEANKYNNKVLGFKARDISEQDKLNRSDKEDLEGGALVIHVEHGSWSFLAQLAVGDVILNVNDKPVNNVFELREIFEEMERRRDDAAIVLFVKRGIHNVYLEILQEENQ